MTSTLHHVWATAELLGIRCAACDHRAVLSPAELPIIRRGNMTRLRDLKLRCGHCGARGQAPHQFALCMPEDREAADGFMRGGDVGGATV
jgi:DNA-directed RNA polymerase subunit RPC12/RpoP